MCKTKEEYMPKHRLVAVGDSLTQGFKSGAIFEPELSFPAILAWEMGIDEEDFRFAPFNGEGGLPINIEYLLRRLDEEFGEDVNFLELPVATYKLLRWMDDTEDYWERGPGARPLAYAGPYHNLAVWGFEIQDAYQLTAKLCQQITSESTSNWFKQIPEHAMMRTALRILNPSHSNAPQDLQATQMTRTKQLADDGGIENLIVFLGANNVLPSVASLKYQESTNGDVAEINPYKRNATVYLPQHFEQLLTTLMQETEQIGNIERVFWGTVPPVTIPPITNGVGGRMTSSMGLLSPYENNDDPQWHRRYFRYYTRPWIPEQKFNPKDDPHLTGQEAIKIDGMIAAYKNILLRKIKEHNDRRRANGDRENWFVVDIHWALERIAFRRYKEDPSVPPPPGWSPYELPGAYEPLQLTTQFLRAEQGRRIQGGIFSLDGIHATTAGYGLIAQEFMNVMQDNGVKFFWGDGGTLRVRPVTVDWNRLLRRDSLISNLPYTLDDLWEKLVDGDQLVDVFKRALRALWLKG
jgi:hypothetical protein